MIPSILAWQLQKGMGDFVDTSFPMTNEPFKGSFRKMAETKGALYHDPYVSVRLPFRKAEGASASFEGLQMDRTPYIHQQKAFERLTGDDGRSTIIATGTGSGKTECFLYPVLDYCFRHLDDKIRGIKTIIVYPMNALASDQARRIAGIINSNPGLRGNITCGMYVGGKGDSGAMIMTDTEVISDHRTLLDHPPDILLTNYKMLDYLLVRPTDSKLWQNNAPDTLKYIVVDELHTFDGAQGTDLACLIRRLKNRLDIKNGYLCCVGTSATMGSGDDTEHIHDYAEEIFGEMFDDDAVITEDRISSDEFFTGAETLYTDVPSANAVSELERLVNENDVEGYLALAAKSWFPGPEFGDIESDEARIDLGLKLMHHESFRKLMVFTDGKYIQNAAVEKKFPEFGEGDAADSLICSMYALISHARRGEPGNLQPFLNVQVQFWMKELRRFVGKVDAENVTYALAPDLTAAQKKHYLPVVNCRECGMTGWATLKNLHESNIELSSIEEFYNKYFDTSESPHIQMIFPVQSGENGEDIDADTYELCPKCLHYAYKNDKSSGKCVLCGSDTMTVSIPSLHKTKHIRGQFICPYCGSRRGLTLVGLRATREISAELSQIFASRFNDDKKVLAFSDSVQDAAHKAGFFNSRTWKYSLHSSVQRYCESGGEGKSLYDFQEGYIKYLHEEYPSDADRVGFFTAPNMTWRHSYENAVRDGKVEGSDQDKSFMDEVEKRLRYEIMLEYGLSGNYGKSLEKTGCSTLSFRREDVSRLAQSVREVAVNEFGMWDEPLESIHNMCIGLLTQLKANGAFADHVFDSFLSANCHTYELSADRNRWLPGSQPGRNTPRFYSVQHGTSKKTDQLDDSSSPKYRLWIRDCAKESLGKVDSGTYSLLCDEIVKKAEKEGILTVVYSDNGKSVYGINKEKVYVSGDVKLLRCSKCGASFSVSGEDAEFWKGAPCRRHVCSGQLLVDETFGEDYFGKLYKNGDFYKINAKEHTGLLEKKDREKIEVAFKRHGGRSAWDPNVLSCTPTLEMGIDVGDLSTVVLCSVPPVQSQFTQRSGRAGRTDGNALTLTVANGKSHDLYFYEDPLDMIEGRVEPPKIFLDASAVLERQLTAYCMDSWVKRFGGEELMPDKIGPILKAVGTRDESFFPYNFINYVQSSKNLLFRQFSGIMGLSENSVCGDELKAFIGVTKSDKTPIDIKIIDTFQALLNQRKSMEDDVASLNDRLRKLRARPADSSTADDIKRIESERNALRETVSDIDKRNVFNFLSDEGILPNYAFPESGIILHAVLYRKKSDDGKKEDLGYETVPYEYSRSAANAISEFAPGNTFYVDGKKLTVDQIDVHTADVVKWRLCPRCSYAEPDSSVRNRAYCPRCGDLLWSDSGQVKDMIKVQMVYSNMNCREAQIDDLSDNRSSSFYNKQMLVDVDTENDIEKAYSMSGDKYDFGYEFVKKATMRDINFGLVDSVGIKTSVAGNENVKTGFTICRCCGKVQTKSEKNEKKRHAFQCKYYDAAPSGGENPYVDCLFLYREFASEALRLLIPFTGIDAHLEGTQSFVAAFMLGMKEYFGNVDHLRPTITNFPDQKARIQKQYLTIYDSVPGGTGYLKQLLADKDSLIKIFEKALDVLENCSCRDDPEKDGCYHCIYPYSINRDIGNVSRKKAIEILKTFISAKDTIKEIKNLNEIPVNHLFDSTLEADFVAAVKREVGSENFTETEVNGKVGYAFKYGERSWKIEPQVDLGEKDGVSAPSRPDFVFWPQFEGGALPVAVFTDGFLYHKDVSSIDTLKREAIRRSGKFRVWSLSYDDVDVYLRQMNKNYYTEPLDYNEMPSKALYNQTVGGLNAEAVSPCGRTSLELLFDYLKLDDAEKIFKGQAVAYSYTLLDGSASSDSNSFDKWHDMMENVKSETGFTGDEFDFGSCLFGVWTPKYGKGLVKVYAGTGTEKKYPNNTVVVCAVLNDKAEDKTSKYERDWNGFLKLCNVMQFSDGFVGVSDKGLESHIYSGLNTVDRNS